MSEVKFVCYLENPELHTNACVSYAGWGETPEEARANSQYWPNQAPWVTVMPIENAPDWVREEAFERSKII